MIVRCFLLLPVKLSPAKAPCNFLVLIVLLLFACLFHIIYFPFITHLRFSILIPRFFEPFK